MATSNSRKDNNDSASNNNKESDNIFFKVFSLLSNSNTEWTVKSEQLVSVSGLNTGSFGVFKNNDNTWLGTTTGGYISVQNHHIAENLIQACADVSDQFTGGSLYNDEMVYYKAELPNDFIAKETIRRYITIVNNHTGGCYLGFTTNISGNLFHVSHLLIDKFQPENPDASTIKLTKAQVNKLIKAENLVLATLKKMYHYEISDVILQETVSRLLDFDIEVFDNKKIKLPPETLNKVLEFDEALNLNKKLYGNTLWALFNTVLHKTNMDYFDKTESRQNTIAGHGYVKNLDVYNFLFSTLP